MDFSFSRLDLGAYFSLWRVDSSGLKWDCLFVLPPWLSAWHRVLGSSDSLRIVSISSGGQLLGVAPLMIKEAKAVFAGSADVCDYLDFVTVPGREKEFFSGFLQYLKQENVTTLELGPVRPDSAAHCHLLPIIKEMGYPLDVTPEDVSVELPLPENWEGYLSLLNSKQRHEVRRKLRRLEESGKVDYVCLKEEKEISSRIERFFEMFRVSRDDKDQFLTETRETYFRELAREMAASGLARLGVLELNGHSAASVLGFDYLDTVYLYNSGYDPAYRELSIGLMSKILCIKDSIERGKKTFDFLKGDEEYKYRLGAAEVPLFRFLANLK